MRQGITIDNKIMRQGTMWKDTFKSSHETMDLGKSFMRQGIFSGNFLCDRVQGVEWFATHPRHFSSQVPPPPGAKQKLGIRSGKTLRQALVEIIICTKYRVDQICHAENISKDMCMRRVN